ncbi:hypothetical protein E3N88_13717 [Mikania micrantha]|uniref:EF-hand domain-containing protein n=1 Tax=Mikania micrantha TaxID=192012 RepID=A0A5N6P0K7_9ASTR|nr:hypothetical protein E3N88_13717 [Mikania micrantha]
MCPPCEGKIVIIPSIFFSRASPDHHVSTLLLPNPSLLFSTAITTTNTAIVPSPRTIKLTSIIYWFSASLEETSDESSEGFGVISSAFSPLSCDGELRGAFEFFDSDRDGRIGGGGVACWFDLFPIGVACGWPTSALVASCVAWWLVVRLGG